MSRAVVTLMSNEQRNRVAKWANQAPIGTRVEFKAPRRSTDQNSLLWSLLTSISVQFAHCGRKYPPEIWKCLMMHAWGREVRFIPSLDGESVVPMLYRSSDLTKVEMTDLIEFILSWGAQNGVQFHEPGATSAPEPAASDPAGVAGAASAHAAPAIN
jgi:NinB protein